MKFNFACYALCEMDIELDEELDINEVHAELLGLFDSEKAAQEAATSHTEHKKALWDKRCKALYNLLREWDFKPPIFQIVPVENLEFGKDLYNAQSMIETAAELQQKGVGAIEPKQPVSAE